MGAMVCLSISSKTHSESIQTSQMELFAKMESNLKPLTMLKKKQIPLSMFDWVVNTPLQALLYFCGIQTVNGNILIRQNSISINPT